MSKYITKDILEFFGLIAVVGSLVFVGIEIQQNSATARLEARQRVQDQEIAIGLAVATNPELAPLVSLVMSGRYEAESMNPDDATTLYFFFFSVLQMLETAYLNAEEGIMNVDEIGDLSGILNSAFVRERWNGYKSILDEDFVRYVEDDLNSAEE